MFASCDVLINAYYCSISLLQLCNEICTICLARFVTPLQPAATAGVLFGYLLSEVAAFWRGQGFDR